ncbi:hypothetical protein GCM10011348_45690 [Marinobacterium nitratireducens]|uniref:Uncharacterized protein n=1 Tax=Marinobacterium nitratireducens TaxID=518897 RepID=A0A917ZSJ5_9GAMM|nr:hypothetical protein [Marinobacterium nitratireducens]GGO88988.1 hypothetical protein GCM10011348_45690 [Marinobacterium nitratireducens]
MAEEEQPDELPTLEELQRGSLIDYVVDRMLDGEDSVEVLDSGEVVIDIGGLTKA